MRKAGALSLCLMILAVCSIPGFAQGKEVTLTGKITCAMCDLKTEKECMTVIVVNEGGKDVTYYLDAKSSKANHDAICQTAKEGSVTGTVSEKGGKRYVTATKVAFKN
jgi:hypothetical protein